MYEIQSLISLAEYYHRFIKNFGTIAHTLIKQTAKSHKEGLKWEGEEQKAFETLRDCLISPPILAYPQFNLEFFLFTDASNYGISYHRYKVNKKL